MSAVSLSIPRPDCSEEEWKTRVDLAACYRLVSLFGMTDLVSNHISARIPGTEEILLNPFGWLYEEITASSLIRIDVAGNILHNPHARYSINNAGYIIHSAVHEARPDVGCVVHTHTPAGIAVSALQCGILPISQSAMRFADIAYHDYEGVVFNESEKGRLVADLGARDVMVLRNHGLLACGATVAQAFNSIYRLERVCQIQLLAQAANSPLIQPSAELVRLSNQQYAGNKSSLGLPATPLGEMEWPAMLRLLDKHNPGYEQ
ncbi:class II aldolase/adducin family protein [Ramlibacter sp. G-1-2-2]|uniref:Class II aldolase/adducin family protein n=1 Tax=Ramlibacter agri TaxID=2728837 RepID=A0A848H5N3_9BURK|nr:class II aldolase/adducin family protein [Ramlibacter agri]